MRAVTCPVCKSNIGPSQLRATFRCPKCDSKLYSNYPAAAVKALVVCSIIGPVSGILIDPSFGALFGVVSAGMSVLVFALMTRQLLKVTTSPDSARQRS